MGLAETPALRLCISGNDLGISGFAGTPIGYGVKAGAAAADGLRRTLREVTLEKFLTAAAGLAALATFCLAAGFRFTLASATTFFRCHGVLSYSLCFQLSRPVPVAGWPPHCGSTDKSSRGRPCRTSRCLAQQAP